MYQFVTWFDGYPLQFRDKIPSIEEKAWIAEKLETEKIANKYQIEFNLVYMEKRNCWAITALPVRTVMVQDTDNFLKTEPAADPRLWEKRKAVLELNQSEITLGEETSFLAIRIYEGQCVDLCNW